MTRYDRYVLSQLLIFFGFSALVMVAVFWINRAVVLFDRLIGDGQPAMVFLEFTALALPNLIRMVLPLSAFAAAVYVTQRLNNESELTVMQATGSGPTRIARPFLVFGLITALMMAALTHLLLPASIKQLSLREAEVSKNISARLLSEGTFLHPVDGITFFIRSIEEDGALTDIFLSDRRDPSQEVTYTAARAFLVRGDSAAQLIMLDGLAQTIDRDRGDLATTNFSDFSYDISGLIRSDGPPSRGIREISTRELILDRARIAASYGHSPGAQAEELHLRFARPITCLAAALLGFAALLIGGYSRFGVWRQALFAFSLLIVMEILRGVVSGPVTANAGLWPLVYLPAAFGLTIGVSLLMMSRRPDILSLRWLRRATS